MTIKGKSFKSNGHFALLLLCTMFISLMGCGRKESQNLSTRAQDDPELYEKAKQETIEWQKRIEEAEKKARSKAVPRKQ